MEIDTEDLPYNWVVVPLQEFLKVIMDFRGRTPKKLGMEWGGGNIPALSALNVRPGKIQIERTKHYGSKELYDRWMTLGGPERGDVVITTEAPLGNVAQIPDDRLYILSQRVILLRPIHEVMQSDFLAYQIQSDTFQRLLKANDSGTTVRGIRQSRLVVLPLPVPPLNEQRRIVTKIEELTTHSQRARQALDDVPGLIEQFRQSVLAAAFRGDLTADWREKNPDVEPAEKLLERIRVERRQRWKEACAIARKEGRRKPKALKEINEYIKLENLPNIPSYWRWDRLVNLAELLGGVTKGRKFKGRSTVQALYLRVANVQDGFLDLDEIKEIEVLPEDIDKYHLEAGDVLFTEGGDRDKLGRGTVWQSEIEGCIHQNHVYRARLYSLEILPKYISLAAKTEHSKDYFFDNASQTVNLASINITTLGKLPIPIPSYEEQKLICRRVNQAFQVIDSLRTSYRSAIEEIDFLNQSILAKAFRGDLVPQDPNDEPAARLLERIRAEREKLGTTKKRRKKPKNPPEQLSL